VGLTGLVGPMPNCASAATITVDPLDFGARFDGHSDDTPAWQAAIDYAGEKGLTVSPRRPGTSLLVCKPGARGTYGNNPQIRVYQALDVNRSGLTIDLRGTRLRFRGHGQSNAVNYAFGTAKNMLRGSIRNLRITNGLIDFDPAGDASMNRRSFYLVGVDGLEIADLVLTSTGARGGATITLQNCRGVTIRNMRFTNVTQGMNLSYVDGVNLDALFFDNFSEAIDCDRRVTRMVAKDLTFVNGGPNNQCLDLNSVEDVLISGIKAKDVGNIALVNYKVTTPPTYQDYVRGAEVSHYSPSRNVVIEHVVAERICYPRSTTNPFRIGNDQRHADESFYPLEDITLRHVLLSDCPSFIPIELVRNAVLEDVLFSGAHNPSPNMGCIDIRGDLFATSAVLNDVRVVMQPGATCGIRSNGPASLSLQDVIVSGEANPHAVFFDLTTLDQHRADIQFDRVTASATSGSGGIAFRFGEGGTPNNYSIKLSRSVQARGPFAKELVLNGRAASHLRREDRRAKS
jgi:hypothetical protein